MSDDVNGEQFDDLADLEALLGELEADDLQLAEPPADIWAGIERRLAEPAQEMSGEHPAAPPAEIVPIERGRRRPATWLLGAAAAAVLVVAGAVVVVATRDGDAGQVVSAAPLAFDPAAFDPRGSNAAAEAQLVEHDGRYSIRLSDTRFPELPGDDDLELWLIQPDANGNPVDVAPVALIDPDGDGTYTVPTELDPSTHFVVDISIEPRDGDASHSGQSILRGALEQR